MTLIACGLTISNKVLFELVMRKYNKFKELCQKDEQTIKPLDNSFWERSEDYLTDENEF